MTGLMGFINSSRRLRFVIRHPVLVLMLIGLLTLVFAAKLPELRFQTSIYDLAIENLPESVYYRQFKKTFGSEEMILVVAKVDDLFAPATFKRLGELSNAVSKIKGVKRVLSLPSIKEDMDLTQRWTPGEFRKIIKPIDLFKKNFLSEDQKTTVMTVLLDDISDKTPVIQAIQELLDKENRALSLYQIGMPLVSKALADYTVSDFQKLPPVSFLIMALVLLFLFRDVRSVLIPSGSVVLALTWTFRHDGLDRNPPFASDHDRPHFSHCRGHRLLHVHPLGLPIRS